MQRTICFLAVQYACRYIGWEYRARMLVEQAKREGRTVSREELLSA